ncbi:glycine betaine/proline transport system substrate-binding protein [Desulfacinum hydrothermale DSM 13146]|uniref:Glycine betaine/proline transport system substrate-binding protein n=1 Tax=Desulfacinum hydrothermale DSM 13146 TaxID=1121390 RepID=A0A1W1XNX8_9BACT|nr:ABC transporter substrate-binding protein [Desulfacinum hydrothermale]SMC25555.1 glycine betaine/proline transport system substrate-binding protein [Desulfacinum hydrothermale DSM 13146]
MRLRHHRLISCLFAIFILFFSLPPSSRAGDAIDFGYVNWPGVTVKTQVAAQILDAMGYPTKLKMVALPVLLRSMANEDLDVFVGAWVPTMSGLIGPYRKQGKIVEVATNLDETIYTLAVPKYVWDAGVKSHADLEKFGDKFGRKIIGIEPGNDGNQIVLDAIASNTYNLGKWKLVEGSAEAMMIAVNAAIKKGEWIVWLGWMPHWMNLVYDMKYLEDPEGIWGTDEEVVKTLVRSGLPQESPEVVQFLRQFKVTPDIQNEWILKYSYEKGKPEKVAHDWIASHLGIVDQWVYGVKAADGRRGRSAVREAFSQAR